MPWLNLTPIAVSWLVHPILAGCLVGYFLSFRQKTQATWRLIAFFGLTAAFFVVQALVHATTWPATEVLWRLTYLLGLPALIAMIAFAYAFPDPFRPRESRWVLGIAGAVTGLYAVYVGVSLVLYGVDFAMPPQGLLQGVAVLFGLWAIGVFVRRARQPGAARQAHRALAGLFALVPLAVAILALRNLLPIDPRLISLIFSLTLMVYMAGFALVYINYVPRPTSFQVKLVGLSLFTVLAVLTVINGTVFSSEWFERESAVSILARQALRFEPAGDRTYRTREIPYRPVPAEAEPFSLNQGDGAVVDLGFGFPFHGRSWTEVHVRDAVSFGQMWTPEYWEDVYDATPKIAPLLLPLDSLYVQASLYRAPGEAVIHWGYHPLDDGEALPAGTPALEHHLRLLDGGAFEFHYGSTLQYLPMGIRGMYPGALTAEVEVDPDVPLLEQATGVTLVEDFARVTAARMHARLVPLAVSLFAATAFILLVFPFFFHVSLVRPLNRLLGGVRRVNDGDLGATVPVMVRDEIGRLTDHFNRMTGSLRQAHDELKEYADHLEDKVAERTTELAEKNAENVRLLLNILPEPIADRLKHTDEPIADAFADVTVLFADLVGFSVLAQQVDADRLVALLNDLFSRFDALALAHGVEKIKTIGDAYMAVCGLPEERPDHADTTARMALGMFEAIAAFNDEHGSALQLRVGLNTGPVVAGVIGTHKFIYDLWGDTVNTASRMESHGVPGRVHVTEATWARLAASFRGEARGAIEVKGKGRMETYLLNRRAASSDSNGPVLPSTTTASERHA